MSRELCCNVEKVYDQGPALVQRVIATESAAAPASPCPLHTEQGWGAGRIAGAHPGDSLPGQPAQGTAQMSDAVR